MARQTVTLHDIPDWQLFCMRGADGHRWERVERPSRVDGRWGWRVRKRCTECGKYKNIVHDVTGEEASVYYEDPPGLVKITEPYVTADVRTEYVRRINRRLRSVS